MKECITVNEFVLRGKRVSLERCVGQMLLWVCSASLGQKEAARERQREARKGDPPLGVIIRRTSEKKAST